RFSQAAGGFGPAMLGRRLDRERMRVAGLAARLAPGVLARRVEEFSRRLAQAAARAPVALENRVRRERLRAQPCFERLAPAFRRGLDARAGRLEQQGKLLDTLSYRRVLDRGFALVETEGGELVRAARQVHPGEMLSITVAGGDFAGQVGAGAAAPRRRPKASGGGDPQESLF